MESIAYIWKDRKRYFGLPISFTRYRLSENRIFREKGFLNLKEEEVLLYRVRDLELTRSLWQRIFRWAPSVSTLRQDHAPFGSTKCPGPESGERADL